MVQAMMDMGLNAATMEYSKLKHWGLIEEANGKLDDGNSNGFWRITPRGREFVMGLRIPRYIYLYDGKLLEVSEGETIDIRTALGDKFNYEELMSQ